AGNFVRRFNGAIGSIQSLKSLFNSFNAFNPFNVGRCGSPLRGFSKTRIANGMHYLELQSDLRAAPRTWLVTGVAGFIGSNILETLLQFDQFVLGLDNFSTGYEENLDEVRAKVGPRKWARARIVEGD